MNLSRVELNPSNLSRIGEMHLSPGLLQGVAAGTEGSCWAGLRNCCMDLLQAPENRRFSFGTCPRRVEGKEDSRQPQLV